MADFNSALSMGIAALDELCLWQGQPTITSRLAGAVTQAQYDAAVKLAGDRKAALTSILTDLDSADTADAAEGAANTAGDAARAAARAKISAAP